MADVLGVVATAVAAGGQSSNVAHGRVDARKKVHLDSYTIAGTETVVSTIKLGAKLRKGSRILNITLAVSANQTAATFSVGDEASATRYASASTSLQTAGKYVFDGQQYVVGTADGDDQIVLTTGGATLTAGTLRMEVEYALD
jgi:hypothetical protein